MSFVLLGLEIMVEKKYSSWNSQPYSTIFLNSSNMGQSEIMV